MHERCSAPHAKVISLHACRSIALLQALGGQLADERLYDPGNDLVLRGENIGKFSVEAIRPDMAASGCLDQLGIDPHTAASAPCAALQHISDAEFSGNLADVDRSA